MSGMRRRGAQRLPQVMIIGFQRERRKRERAGIVCRFYHNR